MPHPPRSLLRLARSDDAARVAAIYAPIVRDTSISFEVEPPAIEEMQRRIHATRGFFPWLVHERAGEVLGYAYASPHHERAAYRWAINVSVYVDARARRSGIGRALYTALIAIVGHQGFFTAHAGVTLPNEGSVGLHESFGFRPTGVYRGVGYKLGAWRDVGWWQLDLRARTTPSGDPIAIGVVEATPAFGAAIAAGEAQLEATTEHRGESR